MKVKAKLAAASLILAIFFFSSPASAEFIWWNPFTWFAQPQSMQFSASSETILWENTKTISILNSRISLTAPKEFTACSIAPDGSDGFDNCTAYIEVYNNLANVAASNLNFTPKWSFPNKIRNLSLYFTKNFTEQTVNKTAPINEAGGMTISRTVRTLFNLSNSMPSLNKNEPVMVKMDFRKRRWEAVSFNFSSKLGLNDVSLDPDVSGCGILNTANGYYTLTNNISSSGTCLTIGADNITVDGNASMYWINYSQSAAGYGINNSGGYNNITIKNLNIAQGSASSSAYAIYASGMANGTITNNTVTTSGTGGYGIYIASSSSSNTISNNTVTTSGTNGWGINIYLSSSSNTISNNTVTTSGTGSYGIRIYASSANTIRGGSVISALSYDYYLQNAGATNNVTGTNFTAQRRIYFYDATSWFNYNNNTGNIWLKTNVSAASSINRTLSSWSQKQMKWNDTNSTSGITANYNLTGLLANIQYNVYNTSAGTQTNPYNLTADGSGALPSFNISLNGNTEIAVNTTGDSIPPAFSLNSANTTIAGNPVNFSAVITDNVALSGYIFETNNTGSFINTTWVSLVSGGTAQNITTLNATSGTVVNYSFYANDSSNNWAVGRWSITTITDIPQWSGNATNMASPATYNPSNSYGFQINWTDQNNNFANATFQLGSPGGALTNYTLNFRPSEKSGGTDNATDGRYNDTASYFSLGSNGIYYYFNFSAKSEKLAYTFNVTSVISPGGNFYVDVYNYTGSSWNTIFLKSFTFSDVPTQTIVNDTSSADFWDGNRFMVRMNSSAVSIGQFSANLLDIYSESAVNRAWFINFTQSAIGGAGTYNYTWFGTDSAGLQNSTQTVGYVISKAAPSLMVAPLSTVTYPTQTQTGCQRTTGDPNTQLTLLRNGTQVAQGTTLTINETAISLGAAVYTYQCNYASSENYSANWAIGTLFVNKGLPDARVFIDDAAKNKTVPYPTVTGIKGNSTTTITPPSFNLYISNQSASGNPASISGIFDLGENQIIYNTSGNANWSSATNSTIYLIASRNAVSCITNSSSCVSGQYALSGFVFSGEGGLAGNGTVLVKVKETGDAFTSTFSNGYFSVSPQFCLAPGRAYSFVLQTESAGKKAIMNFMRAASMPAQSLACTSASAGCAFKTYPISGRALDSKTGSPIQNGTMKVTVVETGDTYSEAFSGGYFSISPLLCLTPGKTYNFLLTAEGGGMNGIISYNAAGQ